MSIPVSFNPWSLAEDDSPLPNNVSPLPSGIPYTPQLAFRLANPRDKAPTTKVQFQCPTALVNEVLTVRELYRDTFDRSGQLWTTAMVNYLIWLKDHYDPDMDIERQYSIGLFTQLSRLQQLTENAERRKLLAEETCAALRRAHTSQVLTEAVLSTLDNTLEFLAPEPELQATVEREARSVRPRPTLVR